MRSKFLVCLLAAGVLMAGAASYAQDVQTVLKKVAAAYKNAKSYQAQAVVTETRQMGGQQQKRSSTIHTKFKAPNKMVTVVQGSDNLQIYSDGKTMYIYSPKDKQYMKMPAPTSLAQGATNPMAAGDPSQIGAQLQMMFGADAKKLPDRSLGGRPMLVIQSNRSGQSQDGKSKFAMTATAFIDKATYMLRQLVLDATQTQGNQKMVQKITVSFASQQINPNLPDSLFVFKPPAGATLRQMPTPGPSAPR